VHYKNKILVFLAFVHWVWCRILNLFMYIHLV
jgi:hypothetical protein